MGIFQCAFRSRKIQEAGSLNALTSHHRGDTSRKKEEAKSRITISNNGDIINITILDSFQNSYRFSFINDILTFAETAQRQKGCKDMKGNDHDLF
jgi:hypothetical protein